MMKNRDIGFSMLELMTVLAIAAIVVALAVPSFNEYFEKSRLRGAVDSVSGLIAAARAEAVRQDRQVIVAFGGTASAWCVGANVAQAPANAGDPIPAAVACDCNSPATCSVGAVSGTSYRGVSVTSVAPTVTFNPKLGTTVGLSNQDVGFVSSSNRFQLNARITPLGHVRTCLPSSSGVIVGFGACP